MKKRRLLLAAVGLAVLLGGCALNKQVDTTTIIVDKDGTVVEAIVEDFDKDYYRADELEQMVTEEISAYNTTAGGEKAKLDSLEQEEDSKIIRLNIEYASASDYMQMNEKELFCGTVSDAYQAGYSFVSMVDQKTGNVVSEADILEMGDKKIVISEETLDIRVPGKITYASDGVAVTDKTATLPDNGEKLSYIIYE
ncbi:MAG: hypothetical protein ACI4AA_03015 [Lachnospiraceae bacterium]